MAKLKLNVEDLRVDSFAVSADEGEERGTVRAHARSAPFGTCQGNTCAQTCGGTSCEFSLCIASCGETCQITCGDCLSREVCF